MKRLCTLFMIIPFVLNAQQKWEEVNLTNGIKKIKVNEQITLGYSETSGVKILVKDGLPFKDLNKNLFFCSKLLKDENNRETFIADRSSAEKWEMFNLNKIEYNHLKLPLEWIFYFPNINNVSQVLFDLEKIKPIFDWISTVVPSQYIGNGNGEGLGLSYVLDKNKVEFVKFDKTLFTNRKENKKII